MKRIADVLAQMGTTPEQQYRDDGWQSECARRMVAIETRHPRTCPKCDGTGLVEHTPSADCPDYEIVCPACNGEGFVEDVVEEELLFAPDDRDAAFDTEEEIYVS